MAATITIDVDGLTVGRLADFIANARFAGAHDDDRIEVIAQDNLGNPTPPHTISVNFQ